MTISVLIPTWRRPDDLAACLHALRGQTTPPDQVVVTVRRDDELTRRRLSELDAAGRLPTGFEAVTVEPGPLTAAMNAGLARTRGDLVALADDDAAPWPDWLERCVAYFVDPTVAGVGGRDWQPHERTDCATVGRVAWYGRVTGNHHLGSGPARDVDVLKGVNACFRGCLLRSVGFDPRLRGRANVSHWELSLCLSLRRAGWRLVYDPAAAVDHSASPRHDADVNARGGFDAESFRDAIQNETLAVLEYLPVVGRVAFAGWAFGVGTQGAPGLAQLPRLLAMGRKHVGRRWWETLRGRFAGLARAGHDGRPAVSTDAGRKPLTIS